MSMPRHGGSSNDGEDETLMEDGNFQGKMGNFALYDEDEKERPHVTTALRKLSTYRVAPPSVDEKKDAKKQKNTAKMGTLMGVYLPCLQNIFGVLFFIRLSWIVGTAGVLESFFIVLLCALVTFLTSISLSAIATNGVVPAGGPYYMISRNLGPELGGAVGILFYLGTTIAGAMYIVGAVEIFALYLVPQAKIFEDVFQCYRLYGTGFLLLVGLVVMAGVKVVNKFALPAVIIVIACIFLTFVGMFVKWNGSGSLKYCMVGERLVSFVKYKEFNKDAHQPNCSANELIPLYCHLNQTDLVGVSPEHCDSYFANIYNTNASQIRQVDTIKGIGNGVINENAYSKYLQKGQLVTGDRENKKPVFDTHLAGYYVSSDVLTSFMILVGVFFPSVTGIMAGSNRSGDLQDPSIAIPRGTIAATLTTTFTYLLGVILMGASIDDVFIRDKFGESAHGKLIIAEVAVPHPIVILIGCFMSTIGAGMQSLTGAPRLMQAIAKDGVIPIIKPFEVATRFGEPLRAQLLTLLICEIGVLIAKLESITALITEFFLMCYLSVNAACALQSILKTPGWRPRFKYYHWSLSLLGAILCIAVMFISDWKFAILAIVVGVIVYKYIEYRGAEKEWGDGLRGLGLSAARYALLNLEEGPPHTRNWRPQVLVLCSLDEKKDLRHPNILSFTHQLKAGKGLSVMVSVLNGDFKTNSTEVLESKDSLKCARAKYRIKGFYEVLVCTNICEGISALIQTSGLGGLKHNTVIMGWPNNWKEHYQKSVPLFVETVRNTRAASCALLVLKDVDKFPNIKEKVGEGTIDVWWIVHDGGLLLLLPFLLKQNRTWRFCKLRLFTVAQLEDNSIKIKQDLKHFLYQLRIVAEVEVVEMMDSDISDYTYERTLRMEQRNQMLRNLRLTDKDKSKEVQSIMDVHHKKSTHKMTKLEEEGLVTELTITAREAARTKLPPSNETQRPDGVTELERQDSKQDEDRGPSIVITPSIDVEDVDETAPDKSKVKFKVDKPESNSPPNGHSNSHTGMLNLKIDSYNVRKMHTAVKMNEAMKSRSKDAQLVIVNLPGSPKRGQEENYMEFIEVLTEGLNRVMLVRGAGAEVVTIYS